MEHSVTSPVDGTVATVAVRPGASVPMDAVLVTVEPLRGGPADTQGVSAPATSEENQR